MRDLSRQSGLFPRLFERIEQPACRSNAHGRAVAAAAVGLWLFLPEPTEELPAVAGIRILFAPFPHRLDQRSPDAVIVQKPAVQQGLRHRYRHDGIIRETGILAKERKLLALVPPVKFVGRSDHVAQKCSVHFLSSFSCRKHVNKLFVFVTRTPISGSIQPSKFIIVLLAFSSKLYQQQCPIKRTLFDISPHNEGEQAKCLLSKRSIKNRVFITSNPL